MPVPYEGWGHKCVTCLLDKDVRLGKGADLSDVVALDAVQSGLCLHQHGYCLCQHGLSLLLSRCNLCCLNLQFTYLVRPESAVSM